MSIFDEDRKRVMEEKLKHKEKLNAEDEKQKDLNEMLYSSLGQPYWTNGYVSKFRNGKYEVKLCNQVHRFVGSIHRMPDSEEIKKLKGTSADFWGSFEIDIASKEIQEYFEHKSICTSGIPTWEDLLP